MNRQPLHVVLFPDEDTLQAWEDMRIEILHELQDGGDADVPDPEIDNLGTLAVTLASWRAKKPLLLPGALAPAKEKMAKNLN